MEVAVVVVLVDLFINSFIPCGDVQVNTHTYTAKRNSFQARVECVRMNPRKQ